MAPSRCSSALLLSVLFLGGCAQNQPASSVILLESGGVTPHGSDMIAAGIARALPESVVMELLSLEANPDEGVLMLGSRLRRHKGRPLQLVELDLREALRKGQFEVVTVEILTWSVESKPGGPLGVTRFRVTRPVGECEMSIRFSGEDDEHDYGTSRLNESDVILNLGQRVGRAVGMLIAGARPTPLDRRETHAWARQ